MKVRLLEAYKALFPSMFDYSEDAVLVVSAEDAIVYANHQFLHLSALTTEQVLSKKFSDICVESNHVRCYKKITEKVISTKAAMTISRVIDPVKSLYEFATISPIINKQQLALGAILIGKQAVVERQLADQEAGQKELYQKVVMDNLSFMIWVKDKESKFLFANSAVAEAAGIANAKSIEGKTDFDLWPKSLAAGYVEDDINVLNSGKPVTVVEQVKKKSGELCWIETYKSPVIISDEIIGTIGYARDITEQKELLSTVSKQELEYTSLVKNLPLSIVRYDVDCKRIFLNEVESAFGLDDFQSLLGKSPEELWDPNIVNITAKEYQNKLEHVLRSGKKHTFESHCKSGNETTVNLMSLMPEFNKDGDITGVLAIASDVTEISKYRYDLEYMAYHDALTSLPNRTLLNQQLHLAVQNGGPFGLMFMDLDFFKTINDTLGHGVGDNLLIDAAKRVCAAVRGDDIVARIGGDEFAILVCDLMDNADLAALARKIAEKLSVPFNIEGINFFVTASIGIACYPTDSEAVEDLMKYADAAMYDAKKRGRDNYQYYTPELTQHAMEHLAIATALRYAIKKDELFLLYQPKVDIGTGKILGAETLIRWNGKVLGQIQPDQFIPIAEESGLIIDIGAWVLKSSCEAATQLNQYREAPLNISVNVSSKEFVGNNYIENLQRCLLETGCKPEWLTLEITESLLLQDTDKALETLNKIDEMGINLSIDDFGTGYSALAYLSKFPIREVKIDRSFVVGICDNQSAASLVRAIIAMTLSLGKKLVAEGIETKEQAALIKQYGCHQGQGYLFSKPISFAEFMHLLQQQIH